MMHMNDSRYLVEPLDTQKHDRAAFSCGIASLDTYLHRQAAQDARRNIAAPYVLTIPGTPAIIGYYTISTASVETSDLPENVTKRLPRYEALPAMLIVRLAVSQRLQGWGIGALLLADALKRCLALSQEIAAWAVLVDALDERAAQFYRRFGFRPFEEQPLTLYVPMAELPTVLETAE